MKTKQSINSIRKGLENKIEYKNKINKELERRNQRQSKKIWSEIICG